MRLQHALLILAGSLLANCGSNVLVSLENEDNIECGGELAWARDIDWDVVVVPCINGYAQIPEGSFDADLWPLVRLLNDPGGTGPGNPLTDQFPPATSYYAVWEANIRFDTGMVTGPCPGTDLPEIRVALPRRSPAD